MPSFIDKFADRFPALANLQFDREVQREKQHVDSYLTTSSTATAPALIDSDQSKAVWKITVPGQEDRFMCIRGAPINSDAFVVMVDAEKFYRTWLLRTMPVDAPNRQDQCLLRGEMHRDYKYKSAAEGFAEGRDNPVPLANCYVSMDAAGQTTVGFTNGVTRTFWLLANRAESFPIQVSDEASAQELHRIAGIGTGPSKVGELFIRTQELDGKTLHEPSKGVAAGQQLLESLRKDAREIALQRQDAVQKNAPADGKPAQSYERQK